MFIFIFESLITMKGSTLYIVSYILLLAIGFSCLTNDHLLGEKERYEIEDSLEELKEGKSFHDLLDGLHNSHKSDWKLLPTERSLHRNGHISTFPLLSAQPGGKYILYCSLKLCS